jgi:hypothetical protein
MKGTPTGKTMPVEKTISQDRFIEKLIKGTKLKVTQKSHAESQLKTMIKFHNMDAKQLSRKVNLPDLVVRRFKRLYKDGWRIK